MPRPRLIVTSKYAYHVRSRSNNQEWFYLPQDQVWAICVEKLNKTHARYGLNVLTFVLMNNHYHMICMTPEADLGQCMRYFSREVSKAIGLVSGRINRIFGGRYQRSLLETDRYFLNAYKYVLRNPVDAGICPHAEQYPFSSLRWELAGVAPIPFRLNCDWIFSLVPHDRDALLGWLNQAYQGKEREVIRLALRKKKFAWPQGTQYKKAVKAISEM